MDSHSEVEASMMETRRKLVDDEMKFCYNALFAADENDDRLLDRSEYITFIDLLGGPTVASYNDLPIVFRSSFSILACRCLENPKAAPDCCAGDNGRVSNAGSGPGERPSKSEEQNLYHVCFLSESSVDKYNDERVPTAAPTKRPTRPPTPPPTGRPTEEVIGTPAPTPNPTPNPTVAPTPNPIPNPTAAPTESPTLRPTFPPNPFPTTPIPTVAPTFKPTRTPSVVPTSAPSLSPSVMASGIPTLTPSSTPSTSPTTALPSGAPSVEPSLSPTLASSGTPSVSPSIPPSSGPTGIPSGHPTMTPSISSAPTTSAAPTNLPSISPSLSPSRTPPDETLETTYIIAVRGSAVRSEYENDLIASMNLLASQVADDMASGTTGRRRLVSVSVFNPTSISFINPTDCPASVESGDDRCESVTANVGLYIDGEDAEGSTATKFKESLEASIENGELQEALDFVNSNSPVYVLTGRDLPDTSRGQSPGALSTGAISGIVIVGLIGCVLVSFLLMKGRNRQQNANKEDYDLEGMAPGEPIMVDTSEVDNKQKKKKNSPKSDESSNAGDSGWSSHGGMSSLDTSSVDDDSRYRAANALGGAAALDKEEPTSPTNNDLKMTYSELDDAIQKGDWAAVGVTAALLASQSYETGGSSETHRLSIDNATLNPSRAAELDRLVEAGDWEGVVAAAAKFDAQEATRRIERSESNASKASSSDAASNASGSGSAASSGSPSNSEGVTAGATSTSESGSGRKLDEIRQEVNELVRQVVPEEQDNVDEMMLQFQGREEELVETLRSMQERQVVQKARIEGQKKAKRDARAQVESSKKQDEEQGGQQPRTESDIAESLNNLSNTGQEDDHFEDDDDEGSV